MNRTSTPPFAARDAAIWAESNLRQLGLLLARDIDQANTTEEREAIAIVGILIAKARQVILPAVINRSN